MQRLGPLLETPEFREFEQACEKFCKTPEFIRYVDSAAELHLYEELRPYYDEPYPKGYGHWTTAGKLRCWYESAEKELKELKYVESD